MIFCIVSVPHSGTNFMIHIANQNIRGLQHLGMNPRKLKDWPNHDLVDRKDGDFYMLAHVLSNFMPMIRAWCRTYPILVPMRHPLAVAESWHVRGKKVSEMIDYYRRLLSIANDFDLCFLPIDSEDRDFWLNRINEKLGIPLKTDWPVIMSLNKKSAISAADRALVLDLMEQHIDFFNTYYPTPRELNQRLAG